MSAYTPRYLAFRVFGNFHWPPCRGDFDSSSTDQGKLLKKGVVEIYLAPEPAGPADNLFAYLRWTTRGADFESPIPEPFTGSFEGPDVVGIHAPDDQLKAAFEKDEAVIRLFEVAPAWRKEKRRLLFRGAFLFDQFKLDRNSGLDDPPLDLRWLLARSFRHYNSDDEFRNTFFSEVVIGQPDDSEALGTQLRFNLALPTPGAQSGDDRYRCHALSFAAIFTAVQQMPAAGDTPAAPPVHRFIAGPGPSDSLQDGSGVVLTSAVVQYHQLGKFGFCAGRNAGGLEFLYFPRHSPPAPHYLAAFWPTSARTFIESCLAMLSGAAHPGPYPEHLLQLPSHSRDRGELDHSVRFASEGSRTSIIFRTRVVAGQWDSSPFGPPLQITDDIRVLGWFLRPHSFQLRVPGSGDKWLDTRSDTLHIERELAYTISDNAIWSFAELGEIDEPKVGGEIIIRLGFAEQGKNYAQPTGQPPADFLPSLFDRGRRAMALPPVDLHNIADGQPQSILPDIEVNWPNLDDTRPASPRFMFCGSMPFWFRRSTSRGGAIEWRKKYPNRDVWAGLNFNLSLWPESRKIFSEGPDGVVPGKLAIKLTPVSFAYSISHLELLLVADPNVPSADPSLWCQFRIHVDASKSNKGWAARLGGLQFAVSDDGFFEQNDDTAPDYSHWRFADRPAHEFKLPSGWLFTNVDFRLRLKIASIRPIATDTPWGSRTGRASPLLIPPDSNTGAGDFVLDLRETVASFEDRWLTAAIYSGVKGDGESDEYVILGEEPFTVMRLHAQPLQGRGAQDNALVASFDSDTRQWQMKLAAPAYHYEFPPQVAGESMDKPRRLEIDDLPADEQAPWDKEMPPAVPPVRVVGDTTNARAVEFRLTPSAEIWIRPSDVERGYFLPEWASREIFRQRGDLGIGAALTALRGEFLYGLSVGIDPTREPGAARSARVAEIEALTGRPPHRLGISNATTAPARRWLELDRVLARRPERIEIWARELDSPEPLAPAKFAAGVTFALRRTALHGPALEEIPENETGAGEIAKVRVSKWGLSGGALWPLESRNFFNALVQYPASTGGSIEQIALSSIGGDANQTAEFLNGRVRIISETRNGFVQRHKVEIIGRICVFWHWAKHVVVYERTVNPSAQFTPDGGIRERTRRPVLRKVSEYIYIRQPQGIRRYPDFPAAKPSTAGLLKAVKFNCITINVDSAWSEDIGHTGWRIPLWNRYAARRRPQVYPRPDIAFSTTAEGQDQEAETSQECIEPDNLYFYSDASPDTSADTDTWPSLVGIDCSALPPPSHDFQRPLDDDQSDEGTNTKASAPRIPRGHRRFTWRLAPPAKKTMINAGRSEKPLYAGLESITFMRSNVQDTFARIPGSPPPLDVKALRDALQSADTEIRPPLVDMAARLPIWTPYSRPPPQFEAHGSPPIMLGVALDKFINAAKATHPNLAAIRQGADALRHELDKIRPALTRDPVLSQYTQAAKTNANKLARLKQFATNVPQQCEQLAEDFVGSIKRKELLILDAIRTWASYADGLPLLSDPPVDKEHLCQELVNSMSKPVTAAMAGVGSDIGQVNVGIEKARDVLHSFQGELVATQNDLRLKLARFKSAYDDGKPWSDVRIGELENKLAAERARAFHAVRTAIEEAHVRLTGELDGFTQGVANLLQHEMEGIAAEGSELQKKFAGAWSLLSDYLARALKRVEGVLYDHGHRRFQDFEDRLDDLKAKAPGHDAELKLDTIRDNLKNVEHLLLDLESWLAALQNDIPAVVTTTITEAVQRSEGLLNAISSVAKESIRTLNDLRGEIADAAKPTVDALAQAIGVLLDLGPNFLSILRDLGSAVDGAIDEAAETATDALDGVFSESVHFFEVLDNESARLENQIARLRDAIGPDAASTFIAKNVLRPAVDQVLLSVTDQELRSYTEAVRQRVKGLIAATSEFVQQRLERLTGSALGEAKNEISSLCGLVGSGLNQGYEFLNNMEQAVTDRVQAINDQINAILDSTDDELKKIQKIERFADGFAADVRQISNDVATSYASALGYTDRVLEAAGNLGSGGLSAVPGNILRLYAAVATAPALPNLDFARARLGYYYNQLNDVIDTTPVEAWFGRLGDELKALGLSFPFSKMGDSILLDDLSNFDVSRIFKNFSGMKLDKLFQGYKLPPGAKDAIRVSHAFDAARARAWVAIDVDLPMPERKAMFTVGPFELDYVDSRFVATVRLEASKDTDKVDETGRATLTTNFDAVVSGQSMVSFQQVVLRYERSSGLEVDFDPKRIRLNAIFQFIQDTLASIFPDQIGGLMIIKDHGIPVGVEHVFSMPPLDLNFATSGVTHIVISNRFGLVAFPEFVISDRFCLSRPELPFIFSIFVIGGTGYITIDTVYRPFQSNGLMVTVEAAAGGSAQIGFAFGPVNGSVFIALSVALAYTKMFGRPGGGLTISLVLAIAGVVDVAGIVTIYIGLLLRMSYRDDSAIDATGTLTVSIQITRFFTIDVTANVQYRLRGGRSQTAVSLSASAQSEALSKAKTKAARLLDGRG